MSPVLLLAIRSATFCSVACHNEGNVGSRLYFCYCSARTQGLSMGVLPGIEGQTLHPSSCSHCSVVAALHAWDETAKRCDVYHRGIKSLAVAIQDPCNSHA